MHIEVPALPETELVRAAAGEPSAAIRARVEAGFQRQLARQGKANARLAPREIERLCAPDAAGEALLRQAIARLSLSARAYHRILKLARSIADLAGRDAIASADIAEAIQYRKMDRAVR